MSRGYKRENTCIHMMNYHFVWCPKYRKKVLVEGVKERVEKVIRDKIGELDGEILKLQVMPDHVHLFVSSNPKISPNRLIGAVKGSTSRIIRREFRHIRSGMPTLWTRSYFVSTAGNVSSHVIEKYIEEQTGK
jgi:putative transposase